MLERRRFFLVISLLILSGLFSLLLQTRANNSAGRSVLPRNLPLEVAGWQGNPLTAAMPRDVGPDDYLLRFYGKGDGRQVGMLALYSPIANYHPPALCYQGAGHHLTEIPGISSSSGRIRLAGLMGKREMSTILVYHGFFINGKIIPDGIEKKLYEVKERLIHGTINQYFFEITIMAENRVPSAEVARLRPFLDGVESYLLRPEQ